MGGTIHKTALYAVNILLFLTSPEISAPTISAIINKFSYISGYRINFSKSEAMSSGSFSDTSLLVNFPFKWSIAGFMYLGLKISPDIQDLWKLNFAPIVASVKQDLIRRHDLPLSIIGRVSLIKMNVLPRLLYPLQMLPLHFSKKNL